jgi:lipopolysaccharide export LptBFGC system permease protein LptF
MGILSLAVLAVPLSLRVGRKETFVNAALALGVALAYYTLMSAAEWVTDPALRPDLLAWAPSLAILGLGVALLRRADRS